jgi:hypothetical protein
MPETLGEVDAIASRADLPVTGTARREYYRIEFFVDVTRAECKT